MVNLTRPTKTIRKKNIKIVEADVLKAFKEEIPSITYSDKSKKDYIDFKNKLTRHYHDLMNFPPKMFEGQSLLDFGAGTGENTVYFENWGAKCTLVEMNDDAYEIAKNIFKKYAKDYKKNTFVNKSIYDFETNSKFDIVHSRGVFAHCNDPELAFSKMASYLKPNGYLIYGDGNKSGNFQNMLQRFLIFLFASDWDTMVEVAEKLFSEDLKRAQEFGNRTVRSIIFDKWVVPRLTQPSVSDVLNWFDKNNIKLYSAWPPILPAVLGDSSHHYPLFNLNDFKSSTSLTEAFWIIQNKMDANEIPNIFSDLPELYVKQDELMDYVDDYNLNEKIDLNIFSNKIDNYLNALNRVDTLKHLKNRSEIFFGELKGLIDIINLKDLEKTKKFIDGTKELFRGSQGIRQIDFIGYKTK